MKARRALLLVAMVVASVAAWVGIPVGWLWVGSQIQGATSNLGAALVTFLAWFFLFAGTAPVPIVGGRDNS